MLTEGQSAFPEEPIRLRGAREGGEVFPLADAYRALGGALPEDVVQQCMDLDARIEIEMESILGPHVFKAYKRSRSLSLT